MIPHNSPTLGILEKRAALRVLHSKWLAQGKEVEKFENAFCSFLKIPSGCAVAVSSGTAALYLSLNFLGAKNKRVAFPAYGCSSLRHAAHMAQAKEVLIDSGNFNPNIDEKALMRAKPALAIVPHYYGIPSSPSAFDHLPVIEDCAQALGARIGVKPVGLHGTVGVFSFYATKLITSGGQGGMIVSQDRALMDAIRDYREFDCRHDHQYRFNFQMTDLQAAIGLAQLHQFPFFMERREEIFKFYKKSGIDLLESPDTGLKAVRYRALLQTDKPEAMIKKLRSKKITAIIPLETRELLGDPKIFSNACFWTKNLVSLPLYPSLTHKQLRHIVNTIHS